MALPPPPKYWNGMPTAWADWFRQIRPALISGGSGGTYTGLDFTGGNITSIPTRLHNSLQNIQGGSPGDYQHLTTAQLDQLTNGKSVGQMTSVTTSDNVNWSNVPGAGVPIVAGKTYRIRWIVSGIGTAKIDLQQNLTGGAAVTLNGWRAVGTLNL
jgi:hypothetical protein